MPIYLNGDKPLENYKQLVNSRHFVDKSLIIEKLNDIIETTDKYICITRPRRFGKTSVTDMLGAYYSKAVDSKELFDKLKISQCESYESNLNKYNVISISFMDVDSRCKDCEEYIDRITNLLIDDLVKIFPHAEINRDYELWNILNELHEKFIFIFDEWDYIFNRNLFVEDQDKFLEFMMKLLKDKPYVSLAYMTGILPIKKYSSGSALNIFDEYTMLNDSLYGEYFGFTEEETKELCSRQNKIKFEQIDEWYNGYRNEENDKIYNPRSVVKALQNGKCISYWTNTGAMDEVAHYLKYNIMDVREDIIVMVAGEEVDITINEEFRAGQGEPKTREEIYSAMIVLGFLSYSDGYLRIPNKELMHEFEKALKDEALHNNTVLAVAICYDSKKKEHTCMIKEIDL